MSQSQNKTGCVCKSAGWCERHKCEKSEHFYHLCKNKPDYFDAWENGVGPGQVKPPSMLARGVNLGRATLEHFRTGMHHCSDEEKMYRFETCKSNKCKLFIATDDGGICGHRSCGCYLRTNGKFMDKLSWAESQCPVDMWGPIEVKIP